MSRRGRHDIPLSDTPNWEEQHACRYYPMCAIHTGTPYRASGFTSRNYTSAELEYAARRLEELRRDRVYGKYAIIARELGKPNGNSVERALKRERLIVDRM